MARHRQPGQCRLHRLAVAQEYVGKETGIRRRHRRGEAGVASQAGQGIDDDLESTLTHEMGHTIGLAHNTDLPTATMYPSSEPGEVSIRTLSSDDIAGAQFLYDSPASTASTASTDSGTTGCSSAPGSGLGGLLLLSVLALARRTPRFVSPIAP